MPMRRHYTGWELRKPTSQDDDILVVCRHFPTLQVHHRRRTRAARPAPAGNCEFVHGGALT
jgi:hypothetical protein